MGKYKLFFHMGPPLSECPPLSHLSSSWHTCISSFLANVIHSMLHLSPPPHRRLYPELEAGRAMCHSGGRPNQRQAGGLCREEQHGRQGFLSYTIRSNGRAVVPGSGWPGRRKIALGIQVWSSCGAHVVGDRAPSRRPACAQGACI
jgi:hypothetical protein